MSGPLSRRSLLATLALGLAALPASALNGGEVRLFTCEKGNCQNGQGSARSAVTQVLFEGPWRNGQSVPGETYTLSHPVRPDQRYHATYAADGLQDSGEMLFGLGVMGRALPVFSGTYAHVTHPFAKMQVGVPKRGQLDTGLGVVYSGRFEYLPGKSTMNSNIVEGTYIFFGTVIDTEDDSRETGLFLSDEQPNGMAPRFSKANATFLAKLQGQYQKDLEWAKGEFAEREASMRWREALAVVGKLTMALATGGVSAVKQSIASEAAMNLVSGMMKNDDSKISVEDATNKAIQEAAAGDESAAEQLRSATK